MVIVAMGSIIKGIIIGVVIMIIIHGVTAMPLDITIMIATGVSYFVIMIRSGHSASLVLAL